MADSQKMGMGAKSGGRRIDDHSFWAGKRSKGSVFPEGAKMKEESDVEGAGSVMRYEDNTKAIEGVQREQDSKIRSHAPKSGHRH